MDPFVDQLKTVCRTFRTRSKWVFVPTHAIGRTLGDRLVLEGTDWANLRFVTPLDIALLMGEPYRLCRRAYSERGLRPWADQASTPPSYVSVRSGWSRTTHPSIHRSGWRFD